MNNLQHITMQAHGIINLSCLIFIIFHHHIYRQGRLNFYNKKIYIFLVVRMCLEEGKKILRNKKQLGGI